MQANIDTNPDGTAKLGSDGRVIHIGSDGGAGFGGNGGSGGGNGYGGHGYDGLYLIGNTSVSTDSGSIGLIATGGSGGFGTGGNALNTGNGGSGFAGSGGSGIYLDNSLITSRYGAISLTGYGGIGGSGKGGNGTDGGFGGNANDAYGNDGHGGNGIHLNYSGISTYSGEVSLKGFGGNGGDAAAGNGASGGTYSWGGTGGSGVHIYGYNTALRSDADISIKGYGGSGGGSTVGVGGDGGTGVYFSSGGSYSNNFAVRSFNGNIALTGHGGDGGTGSAGNGIHGFGVLDNWAGGEGSLQSSSASVTALGGLSLRGAVDSITLSNSGSGDIDYTDANFFSGTVTVVAANTAPFDAAAEGGGAVHISSDLRDITVGSGGISARTDVALTATNGAISGTPGTSSITADSAQLTALNGIGDASPFLTTVSRLGATNTNNAVQLNNNRVLTVTGISNGGLVLLDNQGAMTLNGVVESTGSTVTVAAHSPLTVNSNVSGFDTVTLFAGAAGSASDNLTVNSSVSSQNGDVILKAGENVVVNGVSLPSSDNLVGNAFLTAADITGKVIIQSHLNPSRDPVLTTQEAALLPVVKMVNNHWIATMGNEATDLSDEGNSENSGEGDNHDTESSTFPYCN